MVIGLTEVEEESCVKREIFRGVETENRAEVTDVIEAVRLVDEAVPVIFHGEPLVDAVAASGLQTVDQTESDEVVFIDPVNFIKVVQMIRRFGGFGYVSIVDIGNDHMAETIKSPVIALDILPGAVEFGIEFKADLPGEADAGAAVVIIIDHIDSWLPIHGIGTEHIDQVLSGDFLIGGVGINRETETGSGDEVDIPDFYGVIEHVE